MPRFNGTGPLGFGPGTGRGLGPCGGGRGLRRGFSRGFGRGFFGGRGFGFGRGFFGGFCRGFPVQDEREVLKGYRRYLQEELKAVDDYLAEERED